MPTSRHHVMMEVGPRPVLALYIAANTADYDLYTAAGSPGAAVNVVLTLNSGVNTYPSATAFAIRQSIAFAAGSTVLFINLGGVFGLGGGGGSGASGAYPASGGAGSIGGTAINILNDWTIDNTYGFIFGGGDGGNGGDSGINPLFQVLGGGGGGGGQGALNLVTGGIGGSGGSGTGSGGSSSTSGNAGTNLQNGIGGNGATTGSPYDGYQGGNGYDGGTWGNNGKAIALNGHTVTWTGGNNPTQVKGAVS
jgi:hypothetical protein